MKEDKPIKRICIFDTAYSLFLYFLMCGVNSDDIFILSKYVPKEIRNNIDHIYAPFNHMKRPGGINSIKNVFIRIILVFEILRLRILLYFKTRNCDVEVYGHGHLLFSFPLYEYENTCIIEDGTVNYGDLPACTEFPPFKKWIYGKVFGKYYGAYHEGFGTHPNIKKIYLTKPIRVCNLIEDKVEVKDLGKLVSSLSKQDKLEILKIFNSESILGENISSGDVLLLTEPLSDREFIPLEEEIKIYSELISGYDINKVVIKPHPMDKKDYEQYFPGVRVIKTNFPLEVLQLLEIDFKKILTVCCTATLNFSNVEVEIYDGKISDSRIGEARNQVKESYEKLNNIY